MSEEPAVSLTPKQAQPGAREHYFNPDGTLKFMPSKYQKKLEVLRLIAPHFREGGRYTEQEVNEILKKVYPDFVLLRRMLVDAGFLKRTSDGSSYWRDPAHTEQDG